MNQSILQHQLCVSAQSIQVLAGKHGRDGAGRAGVPRKGGQAFNPLPNAQVWAEPKPRTKCWLEPGGRSSEPGSVPVRCGAPVPSLVPTSFNPGREAAFNPDREAASNPDQTLAPSERRDLGFAGTEPRSRLGNPEFLLPVPTCPEMGKTALRKQRQLFLNTEASSAPFNEPVAAQHHSLSRNNHFTL